LPPETQAQLKKFVVDAANGGNPIDLSEVSVDDGDRVDESDEDASTKDSDEESEEVDSKDDVVIAMPNFS